MQQRLVINWAYYDPAGHVLEGLQHAYGYHCAQPDVAISLLLNAASATQLAQGCPWLDQVYPVSLAELCVHGEDAPSLRAVPRVWDYVVHDPRVLPGALVPGWDEAELMEAQPVIQRHLCGTIWQGASPGFDVRWNTDGLLATDTPLPFQPNASLRLTLPAEARAFAARYAHDGPMIAILPVSTSGLAQSPSPAAWRAVCAAFAASLPGVRMLITGLTYRDDQGMRVGYDFAPQDAHAIADVVPGVVECFDIGMWNQLALFERCDLLCAPHTGFAFLAPFVGTPWLTIAGCPWSEYLFNGVPFYSALPDCPNYPASAAEHRERECMRRWHANVQPDCMSDDAIIARIPDIVAGARYLMQQRPGFRDACERHIGALQARGYRLDHFPYFVHQAPAR